MATKTLIIFCLSLAFVLLISSEVSARDLEETTSKQSEETNGVADAKYDGGHGDHHHGGGHGGYGKGGGRGGGGYGGGGGRGGGGYGGGGGRCYHGCCRRDYHGHGCRRCCSYAGEAVEVESHN